MQNVNPIKKTLLSGSLLDVNNIFIDWTTLHHLEKDVEYQGSTLVQIFCLKPIVKLTQGHYMGYFNFFHDTRGKTKLGFYHIWSI